MTIRSVSSKNYNRQYYSFCGGHKELNRGDLSEHLKHAYKFAKIKKGTRVLDIGCGRGELALKCAKAGAIVNAIDYSQAATDVALKNLAKRADKKTASRVTFEKMDAKKLSFPQNSFDVIFMTDVVEHLYPEELNLVIEQVRRVISHGGRLIIHTPNVLLIKPICLTAKILFNWDHPDLHVNEQSWFSLKRNLNILSKKNRVFFKPRTRYFSEPVSLIDNLPGWSTFMGNLLDQIWENKIISFVIYHSPLVLILGTDLWADVTVNKNIDD